MKRSKFFLIFFSLVMLVAGCQIAQPLLNKVGYEKIDEANAKILVIQKNADAQQAALNAKWQADLDKLIGFNNDQRQGAANELFAANLTYSLNPNPDRNATVVNFHVKAATDYIHIPPTPEAVNKYLVEVKTELDEAKTSLADLQKKYEVEHTKAEELATAKTAVEKEVATIKDEKLKIETDKNQKIQEIQSDKDKTTKELLDKQQADIQKEKEHKDLIRKLMYWTGAIALIALIVAVYVPLMREESIILSLILGGITVALPFIELWMIGIAGGIAVLCIVAWLFFKHQRMLTVKTKEVEKEKTISTNLVNAIQDVKEKSKDIFDSTLKPALEEWNTKYIKHEDGTVTKVEDKETTAAIEAKLVTAQRV